MNSLFFASFCHFFRLIGFYMHNDVKKASFLVKNYFFHDENYKNAIDELGKM